MTYKHLTAYIEMSDGTRIYCLLTGVVASTRQNLRATRTKSPQIIPLLSSKAITYSVELMIPLPYIINEPSIVVTNESNTQPKTITTPNEIYFTLILLNL